VVLLPPSFLSGKPHMLGRNTMPLHTPSGWTFWLSVLLVILAIVSIYVRIPYITVYAFWVAVVGYAILVIGNIFKTA
jgi:hypothetical protein